MLNTYRAIFTYMEACSAKCGLTRVCWSARSLPEMYYLRRLQLIMQSTKEIAYDLTKFCEKGRS